MKEVLVIIRRELASYFLSPVAYAVTAVFTLLYGLFFSGIVLGFGVANLEYTFSNMVVVLLFMAPLMTMRTLAEEKKSGVDELLMTAPITTGSFVFGKFFALCLALLSMMALTVIHFFIVNHYAAPDWGPIITSLIGLFLAGVSFLAVGLFTSALTDNQIIAGFFSFGILLFFWLVDWMAQAVGGKTGELLGNLSLIKHYEDFNKGIIDTSHIIFYLTMTAVFLFLTIRQLESRRWK